MRGVAGIGELRESAVGLGLRLIACESGMRVAALDKAQLLPGVEVAGVATLLEACSGGQMLTL